MANVVTETTNCNTCHLGNCGRSDVRSFGMGGGRLSNVQRPLLAQSRPSAKRPRLQSGTSGERLGEGSKGITVPSVVLTLATVRCAKTALSTYRLDVCSIASSD